MKPLAGLALVAIAATVAGCSLIGGGSSMSCVAPRLVIDPSAAPAGSRVEVTLADAIAECRDTGGGQVGWAEGEVEIVVSPAGSTDAAATVPMVLEHGSGSATLRLGEDLPAGTYEVTVDGDVEIPASAELTVTAP